jgi:hypothetical protein
VQRCEAARASLDHAAPVAVDELVRGVFIQPGQRRSLAGSVARSGQERGAEGLGREVRGDLRIAGTAQEPAEDRRQVQAVEATKASGSPATNRSKSPSSWRCIASIVLFSRS